MPGFNGTREDHTPSITADNWTLSGLTSGDNCKVTLFHWGGGLVATTQYTTRWARPTTAGVGAGTETGLSWAQFRAESQRYSRVAPADRSVSIRMVAVDRRQDRKAGGS